MTADDSSIRKDPKLIEDIESKDVTAADADGVKGGFNPQPDPPKIRGFDPQPDPYNPRSIPRQGP